MKTITRRTMIGSAGLAVAVPALTAVNLRSAEAQPQTNTSSAATTVAREYPELSTDLAHYIAQSAVSSIHSYKNGQVTAAHHRRQVSSMFHLAAAHFNQSRYEKPIRAGIKGLPTSVFTADNSDSIHASLKLFRTHDPDAKAPQLPALSDNDAQNLQAFLSNAGVSGLLHRIGDTISHVETPVSLAQFHMRHTKPQVLRSATNSLASPHFQAASYFASGQFKEVQLDLSCLCNLNLENLAKDAAALFAIYKFACNPITIGLGIAFDPVLGLGLLSACTSFAEFETFALLAAGALGALLHFYQEYNC